MHRIALLQMCSGIDPLINCAAIIDALDQAKAGGANVLFTPEMSLLLDANRKRASRFIFAERSNEQLRRLQTACKETGVWLALGSSAVLGTAGRGTAGLFANRSFVINGDGDIAARYDKIHMFDVDLASGESWRESNAYQNGEEAVSCATPIGKLGLTICYDIRFPALYQALGGHMCDVLAIPAAFTVPTGKAHWHIMQRARAIEATAYVVAAAQTGDHADGRTTYGHSLVVDPWGDVVLDMGAEPGLAFADIDHALIADIRAQLPSLANRRPIAGRSAS
ncbi:carbon-nitrogen hydrolase family protein [Pontixanthobacter sp.]|uniref:carbon-nitrogen hydrolase family protein n=1 Tax=Pontixanthobacter sp. TaxID=2792078 RepID=UPI003C7DA712